MQKTDLKTDAGELFGLWGDNVSEFIYTKSFDEILNLVDLPSGKIADYGGGNGILKKFIPDLITVDLDVDKTPDIVDNILTHSGEYDFVISRYVMHYLNDYEVLKFFKNIEKPCLIVQFCNNDLKNKYETSVNEFKYFRTESQLEALLPIGSKKVYSKSYTVTPEFYLNRLNLTTDITHEETLNAYTVGL